MNSLPVNNTGPDDIVKLEYDDTVSEITVQPVDVWVDTHAVHPVAICCTATYIIL